MVLITYCMAFHIKRTIRYRIVVIMEIRRINASDSYKLMKITLEDFNMAHITIYWANSLKFDIIRLAVF